METTALTLVNRLLRRHRLDDVSNFTSPEAVLALELVNTAIRELLAARDYQWNVRSDGALTLLPTITGSSGLTISTSTPTAGTITSFSDDITDVTGDFVARLLATDAADHSTTALVVESASLSGTTLSLTFNGGWPGATVSSGAYKFFISEYLLPDTVAKVVSVRHQGTPLRLYEVDPHATWDTWMPRPHDTEGDDPLIVATGGTAVASYDSDSDMDADRQIRFMVWPVPNDTLLLNYSYKERMTELSATTDKLYAPLEFTDDVIDRAEAKSYAGAWGNDPDLSRVQLQNAAAITNQKYVNSRLDPNRRLAVRAHDAGGNRRRDPTSYRDITGL